MAKILIADDDPGDRELLRRALERTGATLIAAENGAQALDLARRERPDLIVLDIVMPVIGGDEVISLLRADDLLRETPVVVVTGVAERGKVIRIIERGPDAYLLKPFDPQELRRRVGMLLGGRRTAGVPAEAKRGTPLVAVAHPTPEVRRAVRQAFAPLRFDAMEAETGPGLLDQAHRSPPTIAFLDVELPIINGADTARRLRSLHLERPIPLVAIARFENAQLSQRLRDAGFGAVLQPAFQAWEALATADQLLGARGFIRSTFDGVGVLHVLSAERAEHQADALVTSMAEEIQVEGGCGPGWMVNLLALQDLSTSLAPLCRAFQANGISTTVDLHFITGDEGQRLLIRCGVEEGHIHGNLEAAARSVRV
ncbi:MAG: response regulator [Planctomycetota bacterium]